jgi:hypothetical protein
MNPIFEMIAVALLSVLYGLAWHNQPAREPAAERRDNQK